MNKSNYYEKFDKSFSHVVHKITNSEEEELKKDYF